MGISTRQIDNVDTLPPGSQGGEFAPWQPAPRGRMQWAEITAIGGVVILLLLTVYWLVGRDIKAWIQYGGGDWVPKTAIAMAFLFAALWGLRRVLLVDQRGYQVPIWDVHRVLPPLIQVDATFAGTPGRAVRAQTIQYPTKLELPAPPEPPQIEVLDPGPDIGPLQLDDWMYRLNEQPHAIFAAKTKGGKSTMAKVGLRPRIAANESIFILDPHSNGWLNLPSVGGGLNWDEIEDAMATITTLYKNRMDEREYHMRHTGQELSQSHFPRVTVVFDEANEARTNIEARHKRGASPWQPFTEIMSSGARKVGISLWLICQSALIKNLGGSTVMRRNFTVFALDHATIRELIEDEEPMKVRRDAILNAIGGASFPAATALEGQAFLLDRTNIDRLAPDNARGCAWNGWDYDQRVGLILPQARQQIARPVVSASAQPSATVRASVPGAIVYPAAVQTTNGKIAFLLNSGYSYRQIARELSVSHETISKVSVALQALKQGSNSAQKDTRGL